MALTSTPGPRTTQAPHAPRAPRAPRASREADGLTVASFVLGLLGLLVMNILLGPAAIVMACLALARSTARAAAPCWVSPSASPTWSSSRSWSP